MSHHAALLILEALVWAAAPLAGLALYLGIKGEK